MFNNLNIQYNPTFSNLITIHTTHKNITTILTKITLPKTIQSQQSTYTNHPTLLNTYFQSILIHPKIQKTTINNLILPINIHKLHNYHSTHNTHYYLTQITSSSQTNKYKTNLNIFNQTKTILLTIKKLQLTTKISKHKHTNQIFNKQLLTIK